jgi:hypothetical protein
MKNFYEITVIDIDNQLEVEVELIEHDSPVYTFTVNDLPVVSSIRFAFCLLDEFKFCCDVTSGAIEIAKIAINGHEILPKYQHLATPPTAWITNSWHLHIPQPFYPWYHQITGQGWIA